VGEIKQFETKKQIDAFSDWIAFRRNMSKTKAYEEVAKTANVTSRTILNWHDKFEWEERAAKISKKEDAALICALATTTAEYRKKMVERIEGALDSFFQDGPEKLAGMISKPSDIQLLAKTALAMRGERSEKEESTETVVEQKVSEMLEKAGLGKVGKTG